jgi:peptidoglycan/LPS O-acetylase OafA/YrhL
MSGSSLSDPRRHDLDALRAMAMLLGIALHAALAFVPIGWIVQDNQQHEAFGLLTAAIHGFRMPLFFMMSGFFTAMLWRKRGLHALLQHRFRRIFLPLLLGVLTIVPLMNLLYGLPLFTPWFHHLWFLWHLCWLLAGFALLALIGRRLPPFVMPSWPLLSAARYLWLVPLTMALTAFMAGFGPDTSDRLLPMPHVLLFYAIFFAFGALYYGCDDPHGQIGRWWWLILPMGLLIIFPLGLTLDPQVLAIPRVIPVFFQALYPWVMIFGLMGLFRWLFRRQNQALRYVSDSSYWLYLAHLPLIIIAQYLVREWPLPAGVKFGLICLSVTAILLLAYQTLVRHSWLGALLNGPRRRPLKNTAPATDRSIT